MITLFHMQTLTWTLANYTQANQAKWLKDGKWNLPETVLADAAKNQKLDALYLKDSWGQPIKLVKLDKKRENQTGWPVFDFHELVSAGPDGKFGTADDVKMLPPNQAQFAQWWWLDESHQNHLLARGDMLNRRDGRLRAMKDGMGGGFGGGRMAMPGAAPPVPTAGAPMADATRLEEKLGSQVGRRRQEGWRSSAFSSRS